MQEKDSLGERGKAFEEDYFRRKDRELIEKMRTAAAAADARREMGAKTGLSDPQLLQELEALGFSPDTVVLLPLLPVVEMAWAEGGVTPAEHKMLVDLARRRGVQTGSPADGQLVTWLTTRPGSHVFAGARRLVRAMLASDAAPADLSADELVNYAERIAAASGGILGLNKVSSEEKAILASLASELKGRQG